MESVNALVEERCAKVYLKWTSRKFRDIGFSGRFRAWMDYYNDRRPHSALGDLTPGEVYDGITLVPSAA